MAAEVRNFMQTRRPEKYVDAKMPKRPLRRKAVMEIFEALKNILLEDEYRDKIPEQRENRIEDADHACEQLADAIAVLEEAF